MDFIHKMTVCHNGCTSRGVCESGFANGKDFCQASCGTNFVVENRDSTKFPDDIVKYQCKILKRCRMVNCR